MATPSSNGSVIQNLVAKRAQIQAVRNKLGLAGDRGAPQSNVRPTATSNPTAPSAGQPATDPSGAPAGATGRDAMLQQASEFLASAQNGGTPPAESPGPIATAPPTQALPLQQQLEMVGATNLSPEDQFYRLAGRPPAAREMYVYNVKRLMETELGRPPTRNELLLRVTRPETAIQGPEPVM